METSLQSDFCSWSAFQARKTTLAVLLSSPCPSKYQRQGFALLISVPFLQFLHPPALLHSHVCILAIKALATILQVRIPEILLPLTSAIGCGPQPVEAPSSLHSCSGFWNFLLVSEVFSSRRVFPLTCRLSVSGYKKGFKAALKPSGLYLPS